jgi:hypothetical protein
VTRRLHSGLRLTFAATTALTALLAGCGEEFATGPERFPETLDLRNWSDTLVLGEPRTVIAHVMDENKRWVLDRPVEWSVATPAVLQVQVIGADSVRLDPLAVGTTGVEVRFTDALFHSDSVTRHATVVSAGVRLISAADTTLHVLGDTAVVRATALRRTPDGEAAVAGQGLTWRREGPGAVSLLGGGDTVQVVAVQDGVDTLIVSHQLCLVGAPCADTALVRVVITQAPPPATLRLSLSTAEKLVNGTQQFTVVDGEPGPYVWTVDGIEGGDAGRGTVDASGLYTAPSSVPAGGSVQVCARVAANPSVQACATVTIVATPSAGGDVVVINDVNIWGTEMASGGSMPENQVFFANLMRLPAGTPRAAGTTVVFYNGANPWAGGNVSEPGAMYVDALTTALSDSGYTVVNEVGSLADIAPEVKLLFVWLPASTLATADVNGLKRFASEGGRVIVVGENIYAVGEEGIAAENALLGQLGAQLTNTGDCAVPGEYAPAVGNHDLVSGVTAIFMNCVSTMTPGPNDYPLFEDSRHLVVGAVAKIDVTPLPESSLLLESSLVRRSLRMTRRANTARDVAKFRLATLGR